MFRLLILGATLFACSLMAAPAQAQGTEVAFGGLRADPTLPVEVTADSFTVDQNEGDATFSGNVLVVQGEMRLQAATLQIEYAKDDGNKIEQLHAKGGVTLVSGNAAAEATEADYAVGGGTVVMRGNVLLTQGPSTMAGEVLTVDLTTGTGKMEGRVKTILQPGGSP